AIAPAVCPLSHAARRRAGPTLAGRHDGGKAALLRCHRSASAALGSSRPAATRRKVVARLRSSARPYAHVPSNLLLKNSAGVIFCNVSNMAFALLISR